MWFLTRRLVCGSCGSPGASGIPQRDQLGEEAERLYNAGALSDDQVVLLTKPFSTRRTSRSSTGSPTGSPSSSTRRSASLRTKRVCRASDSWMSPDGMGQTTAASAAKLAHTPIDQLAAEAAAKRVSKALPHMPGHAGSGVVLRNPRDTSEPLEQRVRGALARRLSGCPPLTPMIDGHFVHLVFVDSLPVAYGR